MTAAFSDPSTIECHTFSIQREAGSNDFNHYVAVDDDIEYYEYSGNVSADCVFKKDGYKYGKKYTGDPYNGSWEDHVYELTDTEFQTRVNGVKSKDSSAQLIELCKTSYDDFKAAGTYGDGDVEGHAYEAQNLSFTDVAGNPQTLTEVVVKIDDSDNSLFKIEATFEGEDPTAPGTTAKFLYTYHKYDSLADNRATVYEDTPERVAGRTFYLATIDAMDEEGGPAHDEDLINPWITQTLADNDGKTITVNRDGTISGTITLEMEHGEILELSSLKYTEDFSHTADPYGKITVYSEDQTITLTGTLQSGYDANANLPLTKIQPSPRDPNKNNTFIFTFRVPQA